MEDLLIEICCNLIEICSDFIEDWVKIGMPAKTKVLAENRGEPMGVQCTCCEKVDTFFLSFFAITS